MSFKIFTNAYLREPNRFNLAHPLPAHRTLNDIFFLELFKRSFFFLFIINQLWLSGRLGTWRIFQKRFSQMHN